MNLATIEKGQTLKERIKVKKALVILGLLVTLQARSVFGRASNTLRSAKS